MFVTELYHPTRGISSKAKSTPLSIYSPLLLDTRLIRGASCSTADAILAGNLAETMKLEPYQIYQTSPPANHQQQTGPPPPYYEAQYQRNNGLHTPSSTSYGLPPTPQPANQQRCPIHGLQPCACQMVSPKFLADFSRREIWRSAAKEDVGVFMLRTFGLAMLQNQ